MNFARMIDDRGGWSRNDHARLAFMAETLTTLSSGYCLLLANELREAPRTVESLCLSTGLSLIQVVAGLGHLSRSGIAVTRSLGAVLTYELADCRLADLIALSYTLPDDLREPETC